MESTEDSADNQDFDYGSYDEAIFAEKDPVVEENDQDILFQNAHAYRVLNLEQAKTYIEDLIYELVDELGITEGAAAGLLEKYGWDQQKVKDNLADNLDSFQSKDDNSQEFVCPICFIKESRKQACSFGCNHYYCQNCFEEYIKEAVNEGQSLKFCPTEACKEVLTPKLFFTFFQNEKDMSEKYMKCWIQSIVASSSSLLWCPGIECGKIIQLLKMKKYHKSLFNIRCTCGHCFCMKCRDVAHRPLLCVHFTKWKETEDLQSFEWIEKNSKACPQCRINIEKDKGCRHMTCKNCHHEFCWICLKDWQKHSPDECNIYKPSLQELLENLPKEHESFYKERFRHHWNSLKYAVWKKKLILENFKSINAQLLYKEDDSFLIETLDLIIDTKRAISMTYAAGDYRKRFGLQMEMYELQQSLLWEALDHLDKSTDDLQSRQHMKDLFIDPDQPGLWNQNLENYKTQLKIKTEEIVIVCNKLLKALEEEFENVKELQLQEGLDKYEIDEDWHCEFCTSKNSKTSKICKVCENVKTVFGDDDIIQVN